MAKVSNVYSGEPHKIIKNSDTKRSLYLSIKIDNIDSFYDYFDDEYIIDCVKGYLNSIISKNCTIKIEKTNISKHK
jgi:hypothetical protein